MGLAHLCPLPYPTSARCLTSAHCPTSDQRARRAQVGHASEVLRRSAAEAAASKVTSPSWSARTSRSEELPAEHLSLTLMMMAALPAPPSASEQHDPHGRRLALEPQLEATGGTVGQSQRHTLDLACASEEEFGLWVAALRTLLGEVQNEAASMVAATAVPTRSLPERRDERAEPRVSEGSDKWL